MREDEGRTSYGRRLAGYRDRERGREEGFRRGGGDRRGLRVSYEMWSLEGLVI